MKLNNQSHLSRISRSAKQLSIGGLIGLALLTGSASGQDIAPGFSPGSIPDRTGSDPISILKEATDTWNPPSTPVETSAAVWSPPQTAVPTQLPTSDLILPPSVDMAEAEPMDTIEPQKTMQSVSFGPNPEGVPEQLPSLPSSVPQIPSSPEIPSLDAPSLLDPSDLAGDLSLPQVPSGDFGNELGQSVITGGMVDEFGQSIGTEGFVEELPMGATFDSTMPVEFVDGGPATAGLPVGGGQAYPSPVRNILGGASAALEGNGSVYATGQLTFLSFERDYRGNGRPLSDGVPNLFANGPDENDFTGVDINYGRRRSDGRGWEVRFIGFDPDEATDVSTSGPALVWGGPVAPFLSGIPSTFGLSGIGFNGFSVADVFDNAETHRVTRDSEFGSFEFNILRATAGSTRLSCGNATVELFAGLRAVRFDETISFDARGTSDFFPQSASYTSEVENSLFGLQVGGRLERQLNKGWGYTFGTRFGIFNNRVESRQRADVRFDDGFATPQILFGDDVGREFDFTGKDNELAFLGEVDFGVTYQFRPRTRARVGYRGIAVTNVADAAGQFEDELFNVQAVSEPKAFSDFIVGGFYFGVDHAF